MATSFIFINKHAGSARLTQSEGKERGAIYSHVQARKSGTARSQRKDSKTVVRTSQSSPTNGSRSLHKRPLEDLQIQIEISTERVLSPPPSDLECDRDNTRHTPERSAPITSYMDLLLRFYGSDLIRKIYPIKLLAEKSQELILVMAMENTVVMNTLMCIMSGALSAFGDRGHGVSCLLFKGKAIQQLKQQMERTKGDIPISSLYAVALLLWLECVQGNFEHSRAHIAGLEQMCKDTNAMHTAPLPVIKTLIECSYLSAAMLQTRPGLKPEMKQSLDIQLTTRDALRPTSCPPELRTTATGFLMPVHSAILGPTLVKLILQLRNSYAFERLAEVEAINSTYEEIEFFYTISMQVQYHLLQLPFTTEASQLSPEQEAVRLALFIALQPIVNVMSCPTAFASEMTRQLRVSVERCVHNLEPGSAHTDMLLWTVLVGLHISPSGRTEREWWAAHFQALLIRLGLQSFEELEVTLCRFIYHKPTFQPTLMAAWKSISIDP